VEAQEIPLQLLHLKAIMAGMAELTAHHFAVAVVVVRVLMAPMVEIKEGMVAMAQHQQFPVLP
jgi:dolichol kinase